MCKGVHLRFVWVCCRVVGFLLDLKNLVVFEGLVAVCVFICRTYVWDFC